MNFDSVIEKFKAITGLTKQKDLANILGISPQDFSNRKKIGTLAPVIFEWALHENVNLSWLFGQNNNHAVAAKESGEQYIQLEQSDDLQIREVVSIMSSMDKADKADILKQAKEKLELKVLRAKGAFADILEPRTIERMKKLESIKSEAAEGQKKRSTVTTTKPKKASR